MSRLRALLVGVVLLLAIASAHAASRVDCSVLQSKVLHRAVPYCVLLPPSYDASGAKKFPVAYYFHGLGDNEQSLVNAGGWNIYDQLLREKKIGEFVIAAPAGFRTFYVDSKNGRVPYETFFFTEFVPAMEKKYRVGTTKSQRGLIGVSMGGFGALHYAFSHPQMFKAVSTLMAALREQLPQGFGLSGEQEILEAVFGKPPDMAYYSKLSPFELARKQPLSQMKSLGIRFDCGRNDDYGFDEGTMQLANILKSRGIPHEVHIYPGRHNWQFVIDHFGDSLQFLSKEFGLKP